MAKKVAVAPPVAKKEPMSEESVRLVNEIWEHLELAWGRTPSYQELQEQISIDGVVMDDYHLRQLALKVRSSYRKSGEKPTTEYRDVDPE